MSAEGRKSSGLLVPLLVGCLVLLSPLALLLASQIPFIYYWQFNRIKAQVEKLPDTRIVDAWRHEDVTLEDFGFDLQVRQCEPIRLNFYEGGEWHRVFGQIDGVLFTRPYPATNVTPISSGELARAGIRIRTLADVMSQLEPVLTYLTNKPPQQVDRPGKGAFYVRIFYDLAKPRKESFPLAQ